MSSLDLLDPSLRFYITPAVLLILAVEMTLYSRFVLWYYRLGPPLLREEWQTSVSAAEAANAIRQALGMTGLPARFTKEVVVARRPGWSLSVCPRACLRIVNTPDRAVLVYEVRPFISLALLAIVSVPWIILGSASWFLIAAVLGIIVSYPILWRYELRKFARLEPLRRRLADIGVRICDRCGYDLYEQDRTRPCPECGHKSP